MVWCGVGVWCVRGWLGSVAHPLFDCSKGSLHAVEHCAVHETAVVLTQLCLLVLTGREYTGLERVRVDLRREREVREVREVREAMGAM